MQKLFAYGTLNEAGLQKEVFGRVIKGAPDLLETHSTVPLEIEGVTYLGLVPKEGSSVAGYVIELSDDDIAAADRHETEAYRRVTVRLASGADAWTYMKNGI